MKNVSSNKLQNLKKKAVGMAMALIMLALLVVPTKARSQVFLLEDESFESPRVEGAAVVGYIIIPYDGGDFDQQTPLGDGMLLIGGMGAVYLMCKRKKKDEE
jgi:hypothetical protein